MNRAAQRGGKVSLALIGCGAIAERMFLPVLAGHEGVQIVSLVDRDVERARRFANGYGVEQVLRDVSELSADRVEAAIVATPPFHHAPASIALIKQGIHVLVEKPIALNTTEAEAMVEAADAANVVLAVGYFRRLFPSIRLLKGGLDGGLWGRALSFEGEGGGIYSWPAVTLDNMRRDLAGGGVLIDFGSHLVDLLCYLFDEPAEVLSYRDNTLGGVESDCSLELRLQHRGTPIQGSVELARTRGVGNLIRVCCERATVEFQLNERYRLRIRPHDSQARDLFVGRSREYWLEAGWERETEEPSWHATFRLQIDDFIDAIRNQRTPALAARTALPTTRLIERCYAVRQAISEPWVMHGLLAGSLEAAPAGSAGETASVRSSHTRRLVSPRRRRVLVTGATGFIGGRVAEVLALRDGWDVRALVHTPANASRLARLPVEMVQSDLSSAESVERLVEGCDAVVHCAIGTDWGQRSRILEVTVDGTRRVAEAALKAGARLVHMSTISVYGDASEVTGTINESTPVRPARGSDYGESKLLADEAVQQLVRNGLSAVILRPARVYGPYSTHFVTRPIQALGEGRFRWLGCPDVPADMVYVDNVVEAIVLSLDAGPEASRGEIFTIGEESDWTFRTFYQHFANALGLSLDAVPIAQPGQAIEQLESHPATVNQWWNPVSWARGTKTILKSWEFRAFGHLILQTDPFGAAPRWAFEHVPVLGRAKQKLVGEDGADAPLPIYRPTDSTVATDWYEMGSAGARVSIEKARRLLGYHPPITADGGLELTLAWVRHARLLG